MTPESDNLRVFPRISVVICTYNRADLLRKAIQSLCDQTLEPAQFEVIVVDNNSTDHTAAVVAEFQPAFALRYVAESQQGLSHARNRGWQEAKAAYVGYLDDDALAPPRWLSLALSLIVEHEPYLLGGPVREYFESERPVWFIDAFLSGRRMTYHAPGQLQQGEWLFGGNLFVKREVIEQLRGFPASLGMQGKRLAYGEETLVLDQVRSRYPDGVIFVHPDLYILHLIRSEKMTVSWMLRSSYSRGRSEARHKFLLGNQKLSWRAKVSHVLRLGPSSTVLLLKLPLSPLLWRRSRYRDYPNMVSYSLNLIFDLVNKGGQAVEALFFSTE